MTSEMQNPALAGTGFRENDRAEQRVNREYTNADHTLQPDADADAQSKSALSGAERQRRYRKRHRNVTPTDRNVTPKDGDDVPDSDGQAEVILKRQDETSIYIDAEGSLVIEQQRWPDDQCDVIVIAEQCTQAFLDSICDKLGAGGWRP
jgi:hypothetical protein